MILYFFPGSYLPYESLRAQDYNPCIYPRFAVLILPMRNMETTKLQMHFKPQMPKVLILPMRNRKPTTSIVKVVPDFIRLILLWGMRNPHGIAWRLIPLVASRSLSPPMRNGNPYTNGVVFKTNPASSSLILPMRNGNYLLLSNVSSKIWMFLSYLWGMETGPCYWSTLRYAVYSSYPTYWGMETRVVGMDVYWKNLSSYPTYEEWKRTYYPSLCSPSISPDSYPTYEEWKRSGLLVSEGV